MTDWRRDAEPLLVCACGHTAHAHDDTKRRRCSHHGCGCTTLAVVLRRWREHRWTDEPV